MTVVSDEEFSGMQLPSEVNRELFSEAVEQLKTRDNSSELENFNVDSFLVENRLQYVQLDTLITDVSSLSREMGTLLLDHVADRYGEVQAFCQQYDEQQNQNGATTFELQNVRGELRRFIGQLEQLSSKDIMKSREVISDAVEYLGGLDNLQIILEKHETLAKQLDTGKKLSKSLHVLCAAEDLDVLVCSKLTEQLASTVESARSSLLELEPYDSAYLQNLRNEYQSLVQLFQVEIKILIQQCLDNPQKYGPLIQILISKFQGATI